MGKYFNKSKGSELNMINIKEVKEIMQENNIDVTSEEIGEKTFKELGIDSVDMMMMIFAIKEKYQIDFMINRENTINQLIFVVNNEIENKK